MSFKNICHHFADHISFIQIGKSIRLESKKFKGFIVTIGTVHRLFGRVWCAVVPLISSFQALALFFAPIHLSQESSCVPLGTWAIELAWKSEVGYSSGWRLKSSFDVTPWIQIRRSSSSNLEFKVKKVEAQILNSNCSNWEVWPRIFEVQCNLKIFSRPLISPPNPAMTIMASWWYYTPNSNVLQKDCSQRKWPKLTLWRGNIKAL